VENIEAKVTGNKLLLTIDLDQAGKPSKTGNTKLIASSRGAQAVEYKGRGVKCALNVMVPV
jgi:hypothetical protein